MSKITVCLENRSHDIYLNDSFINATTNTKMLIRNVAIFWNFFNILTDVNDTIIIISKTGVHTKVTFNEGYYTFGMIHDKLSEYNLILERNAHNNTCKLHKK